MHRSIAVVIGLSVLNYVCLLWLEPEKAGFPTVLMSVFLFGAITLSDEKDIVATVRRLWRSILFGASVFLFPSLLLPFKSDLWSVPVALAWALFAVIAFDRLQRHWSSESRDQ
ncbi:MAG: hypothetical protein JF586_20505 [Burkholderiales bacterium]|nr:hypothetical protein [Burkholderiales bacterium]